MNSSLFKELCIHSSWFIKKKKKQGEWEGVAVWADKGLLLTGLWCCWSWSTPDGPAFVNHARRHHWCGKGIFPSIIDDVGHIIRFDSGTWYMLRINATRPAGFANTDLCSSHNFDVLSDFKCSRRRFWFRKLGIVEDSRVKIRRTIQNVFEQLSLNSIIKKKTVGLSANKVTNHGCDATAKNRRNRNSWVWFRSRGNICVLWTVR